MGQDLLQLLGSDALLFEKQFADADGHVRAIARNPSEPWRARRAATR